jgi:hypothetical protein
MEIQSLATDQLFYFFLRLRKGEIRRTVQVLQSRYPEESPAQLAQRLIDSKATVSLIGGTLLHLPLLFPGIGQALKLLGVVGATSLLTSMHLYLILEIALVFGKDIDDQARVPEMENKPRQVAGGLCYPEAHLLEAAADLACGLVTRSGCRNPFYL